MTLDDVVAAIADTNLLMQLQTDAMYFLFGVVLALILAVSWKG